MTKKVIVIASAVLAIFYPLWLLGGAIAYNQHTIPIIILALITIMISSQVLFNYRQAKVQIIIFIMSSIIMMLFAIGAIVFFLFQISPVLRVDIPFEIVNLAGNLAVLFTCVTYISRIRKRAQPEQKTACRMKKPLKAILVIFIVTLISFIDSATGIPLIYPLHLILGLSSILLPVFLILYLILPAHYKSKNDAKKGIILSIIALIALACSYLPIPLGRKILFAHIEKTGAPIIKALEDYHQAKNCYPEELENVNIKPSHWLRTGFGYYHMKSDTGVFLIYHYGYNGEYGWSSGYKRWEKLPRY